MTAVAPYIVFEGIDGSGKSTLAHSLVHALAGCSAAVVRVAQPGSVSRAGQLIQGIFDGHIPFDSDAMLWLFIAEMADLEPRIAAMRAEGVTVVCDRHTMFSAYVYQAPIHGRGTVEAALNSVNPAPPTHAFIVDVPPEVALSRQRERGTRRNRLYEPQDLDRVRAIRDAYLALPKCTQPRYWPNKINVLDGTKPVEANLQTVLQVIGR